MSQDTTTKQLRVRIHGRVQGVGFRAYTARRAQELGVAGWVRNEPDGTVRVVAEGTQSELDQFLSALKHGPRTSYVERVEEEWTDGGDTFDAFRVRYF